MLSVFGRMGRRLFQRLFPAPPAVSEFGNPLRALHKEVQDAKLLAGRILTRLTRDKGSLPQLDAAEFKVFSQFGDDGIIQYAIHRADVRPDEHTFIEFGVEDYNEANTRFLLLNDNWRGLVMDGSIAHMSSVTQDEISWKYDLTAREAFIDRDNINDLFASNGFCGDIGLLSIDIDGNDYWVWEAVHAVCPVVVIVEYNSVFGSEHAITIPYDPAFQRTKAHFSNLYWGASLKALTLLSRRKGYSFVGCNSNGNNAYFVRNDRLGEMRSVSVEEGYRESRFRESRDARGALTYVSGADRLALIEDMVVWDVESERNVKLGDLPRREEPDRLAS